MEKVEKKHKKENVGNKNAKARSKNLENTLGDYLLEKEFDRNKLAAKLVSKHHKLKAKTDQKEPYNKK